MFEGRYYQTRFIYTLEGSEYKALVEPNFSKKEAYVFLPDAEKSGDYAVYLRKFERKPLDESRIETIESVLSKHGFTDLDFINPFTRTKKLVNVLDVINNLEKNKTKIKK